MHINNLKKYYFINKFDPDHIKNLHKNISIIYRNYSSKYDEKLIFKIKKFCKKSKRKFFLSNNFKLAIKLRLDGVYLPSFNRELISKIYTLNRNFKVIGSAHNVKEMLIKEKQGVSEIFFSSLFKKNKNYLGINKFKVISSKCKVSKIALGGVNQSNINKLKLLNVSGFAGISYFEDKKKAPKIRGL